MKLEYVLNKIPIIVDRVNKKDISLSHQKSKELKYSFNDFGYRSEFDYNELINNSDYIVTIGCSFTSGIGLDYNQTWSYKLGKLLDKPVINLGIEGASHGYVMWQIYNVINNLKSKNIFVLRPPKGRRFELNDSEFENQNHLESWSNPPDFDLSVNYAEYYDFLLTNLCDKFKIPNFFCYEFGFEFTLAKDDSHFGEDYHNLISNEFYKNLKI